MEGTAMRPAELRLVAAVKAGEEVDLSACPERERALRASVLREILLSHVGDEQSPGSVRLRGAVIDGDLDLSDVPEAVTVDLIGCQVTRICLHGVNPPLIAGKRDEKRSGWLGITFRLPDRIGMWQFITVLAFAFVVIKVIWIARGDIPTALGVFNSAGLVTVIVGGLLSALPLISAAVLGLAMFEIIKSWILASRAGLRSAGKRGRIRRALANFPRDTLAWVGFSAAAVAGFVLTPWPVMASGAFLGLISGVAAAAWSVSKTKKSTNNRRKWVGVIIKVGMWAVVGILSFILVLNPLLYAVWLPHETLALPNSHPNSMVGYVLSDSNGWISLLRSGERKIHRFRTEDVTGRALCSARSFSMPFAPPWFNNPRPLLNLLIPGESKALTAC
jgi:hypothetical protein